MIIHSQRPGSGTDTRSRRMLRVALPVLATVAIVAPLLWMWQSSRMPAAYPVMEMGYLDYGGGVQPEPNVAGHSGHGEANGNDHHSGPARSITELVADPARQADVRVDLVTLQEVLTIGGREVAGFTVNGTSPGPEIRARPRSPLTAQRSGCSCPRRRR
jgi:hypothetical protein